MLTRLQPTLAAQGTKTAANLGCSTNNHNKMSKKLILILAVLCSSFVSQANEMEDAFIAVKQLYEQREKGADRALQAYIKRYPYTTYADEVRMMMGVIQVESKHYKQALKNFEEVKIKRLGRDQQPEYMFYRGYAYLMMGEYRKSLTFFNSLKQKDTPYTLASRYYYAFACYKIGDYDKALPEFLAIEHTLQYSDIVPYYIIQIYYSKGNLEEVEQRATYIMEANPGNPNNGEVERILGELQYQRGAYARAIPHLEAYEKSFTKQKKELVRNDLYLLGMSYYNTEQYDKAIKYLKKVKPMNDSISESVALHLGHAYTRTNNIEQGKLSYAAAVRYGLTPKLTEEAMYNYALCTYQSSSALGESVTAFTEFLRTYPKSKHTTTIRSLLSDAFLRSKNYQAAYEALQLIDITDAKMEQTKQYLRYQLGADAFRQGNLQKAQQFLQEILRQPKTYDSYNAEACYLLAECAYRTRNYKQAEQYLTQAEQQEGWQLSPNKEQALYLKGYAYFQQRMYVQAAATLQDYVGRIDKNQPTYADALNRIGDCQFNARKFDEAIHTYQQVIDLNATGADYAIFQAGYAYGLKHQYVNKAEKMLELVTTYPQSDYADDALYEMARAYIENQQEESAIMAYERLLSNYPNSNMARKASLEQGMIYRNLKQYDDAIRAFKRTIKDYPSTEEAYAALDGLEQVYVATNNISEYLAYTKKLGKSQMRVTTAEDSLTYVTAELQYMLGNYAEAAAGLATYLTRYCNGGRYCTNAHYYAADSYYRLGKMQDALSEYEALTTLNGNAYMEEACLRAAGLSFDNKDYESASRHFRHLQEVASTEANRRTAQLGILRCAAKLQDNTTIENMATEMLEVTDLPEQIRQEALYFRAKAYMSNANYGVAVVDLTPLAQETSTAIGAESKYLLALAYFNMGALTNAEEEVMAFARMNTQHQYWLAKAMILLADISLKREDAFQAQQYLLALQANYHAEDDIQQIIAEKLATVNAQLQPQADDPDDDQPAE